MSIAQSTEKTASQPFINVLKERRSVRQYDASVVIPREELTEILELAARAPSSSNLQPWRFLVIDSPELKEKLLPIANNQQQVADASAVIAVLGDVESYRNAHRIYEQAAAAGYMPADTAKSFGERSYGLYSSLPPEVARSIVYTDGGLVSMQLMLVARAKGYDTVPMGGYNKELFKQAYGISERYVPIMLIALGKAAKEGHPTTRLPIGDIAFFNEFPQE